MKIPRWYIDFWHGPEVSKVQLSRFRLVFFAIVVIDAFKLVAKAPRYGATDFNVSHFPAIEFLLPVFDRPAVVVCALVMSYLAARVAMGATTRLMLIPLAAIYSLLYFSSQLDSFQHHYLLALLLISMCMINWKSDKPSGVVIRLMLLQVSVVYFFAAISKMETGWWDGRALEQILGGRDNIGRDAAEAIGWAAAAKLAVLTELFLAFAIHFRQLRIPAVIAGVGLHVGIELADLKIELFSYYMIAFYLLVLPPKAFRFARLPDDFGKRWFDKIPKWPTAIAGAIAGFIIVATLPLDGAVIAAVVITLLAASRSRKVAIGHIVCVLAVLACAHTTDTIRDHYRFHGGSERRLGNTESATAAYKKLTEIEPSYAPGRRNLGRLYLAAKKFDDALVEYQAAARYEPDEVASQLGLANTYAALGRGDEAIEAARKVRELAKAEPKRHARSVARAVAILRRFGAEL